MENKFLIIAIVILILVAVVTTAGYFLYFKRPVNAGPTAIPGGPKETYIKYLTEVNNAETLEDFYKTAAEYGYFDTPEQKNEAIASISDLQKLSITDKIRELKYLKNISQAELKAAPQLIETVNGQTAVLASPVESGQGLTVNMIKEGESWKIR